MDEILRSAAERIASRRGEMPASPRTALLKLFVQPRRNWALPGTPQVGWKRGELVEFATALLAGQWARAAEEWGDVGYYVAQMGGLAWRIYVAVTPRGLLVRACSKFEQRAT